MFFYFCPIVLSWTLKMLTETCSVWNLVLGFSLHCVILVKIDWNVHSWKYHETSLRTLLWNISFHSGGHICWWSVKQVHLTRNTRLLLTQEEAVRMYLGFFPHRAAYSPMKIVFFTSVVRFIQSKRNWIHLHQQYNLCLPYILQLNKHLLITRSPHNSPLVS